MRGTSPIRNCVSFKTTISSVDEPPEEAGTPPEPPGRELAAYLADHLRQSGITVSNESPYEDYCRLCECRIGDFGFEVRIGYVGDQPQQWLITIDSTLGFWKKLRGQRDDPELSALATAIDHALRDSTAPCSSIRWYSLDQWDEGAAVWSSHPLDASEHTGNSKGDSQCA